MNEKKEALNLPRYKTDEYYIKFNFEKKDEDIIQKLKQDGELTPESKVEIKKRSDYNPGKKIVWERQTMKGTESIRLGEIDPTDGFLEFMDKFLEKKGLFGKHWLTTYGAIVSVCELCQKDQEKFKKLVRKAENINELLTVSAFRD